MNIEPISFHLPNQPIYLDINNTYTLQQLAQWKEPTGPLRVGLQVGHLESNKVPEEIEGIKRNKNGAQWKKVVERDVNLKIVTLTAEILRKNSIVVDILPATVPPGYVADAFVAVHADGNPSAEKTGFKVASPRRDFSKKSLLLEQDLFDAYVQATGMPEDPKITGNMRGYYAFNWPRYIHAIHPMTPAAIVEVGFITNANDRKTIVNNPKKAAEGIANGILKFLDQRDDVSVRKPTPPSPDLPISGKPICLNDHLHGKIDTPNCVYGIETRSERQYALDLTQFSVDQKQMLTSAVVTVSGAYQPIAETQNYEWYHYDVDGIIKVNRLE
jgi:hypothetical protein